MDLKLKKNSKPQKEALKKVLETRQTKRLIPILNCVSERSPISFDDVKRITGIPHSTVFKGLKDLVNLNVVSEVIRDKNTATGIKKAFYYSTPFKVKFILLEKQETISRFRIEVFDLVVLVSMLTALAFIMILRFREAIGTLVGMISTIIYWIYYRIARRGNKWKKVD